MNLTKHAKWVTSVALITVLMAACAKKDTTLKGERLDLRTPLDATAEELAAAAAPQAGNRALPIKLPAPVNHANWTHRNGSAQHRVTHPALGANLTNIWSASIGTGENRKYRITADPVIADGRIFTLDARALVMAHSLEGVTLWSHDLTPDSEKAGEASGGGLAISGNTVYATTGYGALVAMNATTGAELWVQDLEASATGAPTVRDGIVYISSRDSRAWAVDAKSGRIKWQLPGAPTPSVMVGGAGPAVSDKFVVFPYGSGELIAAFRKGGVRTWASSVSGKRRGRAYAGITDITGDPVISGNVVYAGNQSGRLAAIDLGSGDRIWTATEGAYSPVWPVGGSLFLVSDEAHLVRLDAATGETIWNVELPYFTKERARRRKAVFTHYGPVLAGGRLIVASNDGVIRSFNPRDGSLVSTVEIAGGATTNPVVAGGVLYLVSTKGKLFAFR